MTPAADVAATTPTTAATSSTARGCSACSATSPPSCCIRHDGDEGLFRAYDSVEFLAPVYAGDYIEAEGEIVEVGEHQPEDALRGAEGDPAAARRVRLGGRGAREARSWSAARAGPASCRWTSSGGSDERAVRHHRGDGRRGDDAASRRPTCRSPPRRSPRTRRSAARPAWRWCTSTSATADGKPSPGRRALPRGHPGDPRSAATCSSRPPPGARWG